MAIPVSKSIKTFLEELKNRIELLSGSKVTENIDNCKINEINSILSHYDISDEREMNSHDLMMLPKNEIKKLLTYVGPPRKYSGKKMAPIKRLIPVPTTSSMKTSVLLSKGYP